MGRSHGIRLKEVSVRFGDEIDVARETWMNRFDETTPQGPFGRAISQDMRHMNPGNRPKCGSDQLPHAFERHLIASDRVAI